MRHVHQVRKEFERPPQVQVESRKSHRNKGGKAGDLKEEKRAMEARGKVLMEGEPRKHAFAFTYLGYDFRADGKAEHAIEERMRD